MLWADAIHCWTTTSYPVPTSITSFAMLLIGVIDFHTSRLEHDTFHPSSRWSYANMETFAASVGPAEQWSKAEDSEGNHDYMTLASFMAFLGRHYRLCSVGDCIPIANVNRKSVDSQDNSFATALQPASIDFRVHGPPSSSA